MKYLMIIASVILILFFLVPTYIDLKAQKKKPLSLIVKALGTSLSVGFGIAGVLSCPNPHSGWILTGLVLGLLGDIFLEYFTPLGGVLFFAGNTIYLSQMLSIQPIRWYSLLLLLLLLTFLYANFHKDFPFFGPYRYLFLLYAILVSLMASISIPLILLHGTQGLLLGFGTFLFTLSDYLLGYRTLYHAPPPFHRISLSVYYLAQLLISLSIFLT